MCVSECVCDKFLVYSKLLTVAWGLVLYFFNQVMDRTNVTTYDDDDPFFFF